MKRYLLCELDDEHYAEPEFYIYDSREGAFKDAVSMQQMVEISR